MCEITAVNANNCRSVRLITPGVGSASVLFKTQLTVHRVEHRLTPLAQGFEDQPAWPGSFPFSARADQPHTAVIESSYAGQDNGDGVRYIQLEGSSDSRLPFVYSQQVISVKFFRFGYSLLGALCTVALALVAAASIEVLNRRLETGSVLPFQFMFVAAGIVIAGLIIFIGVHFLRRWHTLRVLRATLYTVWFCMALVPLCCVWFIVSTGYFAFAGAAGLLFTLCVGGVMVHTLRNVIRDVAGLSVEDSKSAHHRGEGLARASV